MEDVLEPGTRLGRYEIVRRLATGGMAEIYLARMSGPSGFAKHVVLKRILPSYARDDEFVRMFHNEARYAATLDHPNIAHVYDLGEEHGLHYFTMEYLHGDDCRALIRAASNRRQPIPLEHALTIVIGAAAGCHFAHEMTDDDGRPLGLVHRDISPSNVVVTYAGAIKIVDFGIAKATNVEAVTAAGATKGKLAYMAPEQGRSEPVDRRADVYALGVLLYELTTLRRAFLGEAEAQILWHVISGEWPRPSTVVPGYPPALEAIVEKAMQLDREHRYATARELQQALEAFAAEADLTLGASRLGELLDALVGPKVEPWRTGEPRPPTAPPTEAEALADTAPGALGGDPTPNQKLRPSPTPSPNPNPYLSPNRNPNPNPNPNRNPNPNPNPNRSPYPNPDAGRSDLTTPYPLLTPTTSPTPSPMAAPAASTTGLRPGSGRVPWLVGGVLALGGVTAVGYVLWAGTRRADPPVVMVAERGSATVETIDAAPAVDPVLDPAAALDAARPAPPTDAAPPRRPVRPLRPTPGDPLSRAFAQRTDRISACFAAHSSVVVQAPELVLRFEIDAAGVPTAVELNPPELARTPLGACIVDVGRGTRFPSQPEPVAFRIPLALRKAGGS